MNFQKGFSFWGKSLMEITRISCSVFTINLSLTKNIIYFQSYDSCIIGIHEAIAKISKFRGKNFWPNTKKGGEKPGSKSLKSKKRAENSFYEAARSRVRFSAIQKNIYRALSQNLKKWQKWQSFGVTQILWYIQWPLTNYTAPKCAILPNCTGF